MKEGVCRSLSSQRKCSAQTGLRNTDTDLSDQSSSSYTNNNSVMPPDMRRLFKDFTKTGDGNVLLIFCSRVVGSDVFSHEPNSANHFPIS